MQLQITQAGLSAPDFRGGRSTTFELRLIDGPRSTLVARLIERCENSYSESIQETLVEAALYRLSPRHLVVAIAWDEEVAYVGTSRTVKHHESLDDGLSWRRCAAPVGRVGGPPVHRVVRADAVGSA